ncbi:protein SRC2-like [Durio zibethinus]|uniref:Protein SRC2-like n=1 Tax=Durio zibethinus TaxID=66656 RepID=A0A6P5ZDI4_DURZI|nr:protein SRC2-like [Durio zibethinus]
MESSFIEIKVISCKDLKAFNFFQKLSVYALVSFATEDDKKVIQKQQQRTPTDREGNGNPEWNHTIRFEVSKTLFQDCDNVFIHFELRHEGVMFGDKTIGVVHVLFKDLIQESNGVVRFVTYEVRTTDGKSNGVLNFSFMVSGNNQGLRTDSPASQIAGYPVFHHHHSPETQFCLSEVHSESPKVHYPSLELENMFQGPQLHTSSSGTQDPFQETYCLPQTAYYQLSPPPPPPPPPPAPMAHGPCYHPPPPGPNPWGPSPYLGAHGYSTHGSQMGSANLPFEMWPSGWQAGGNHSSSCGNGR